MPPDAFFRMMEGLSPSTKAIISILFLAGIFTLIFVKTVWGMWQSAQAQKERRHIAKAASCNVPVMVVEDLRDAMDRGREAIIAQENARREMMAANEAARRDTLEGYNRLQDSIGTLVGALDRQSDKIGNNTEKLIEVLARQRAES